MSAVHWTIAVALLSFGLSVNAQTNKKCNVKTSWTCGNGDCIDITKICNGAVDCVDGSDETVTECISVQCPKDKFRCAYGACVDPSVECNNRTDCADGSDELTRKCVSNLANLLSANCSGDEFQCRSGECIPSDSLCNGHVDCSDQSDESLKYCASKCCPSFGFRCGYGACIDSDLRCDGNADCADNSDENRLLCGTMKGVRVKPKTPKPHPHRPSFADKVETNSSCDVILSWTCGNGECIDILELCDGKLDCLDGSDETATECISVKCHENEYQCAYGACVNLDAECNGRKECADNSDELTGKCLPNLDKMLRGNCSENSFQCRSGECIPLDGICDGSIECADRSDESVETCASNCCPMYGFRCGYGGCIDNALRCDGNFDCADHSDENYLLCGTSNEKESNATETSSEPPIFALYYVDNITNFIQPTYGSCEIGRAPHNGWIEYAAPPNDKVSTGEFVPSLTQIVYKCLQNHVAKGATTNICIDGKWRDEAPDCNPFCNATAITGVSFFPISCKLNDVERRCGKPAEPGTIVRINCRDRYERHIQAKQQVVACGDDGLWASLPVPCTPICGEPASIDKPHSTPRVPWHVAIYKRNGDNDDFRCGGTIINERVIVSAMSCFWNPTENKPFDVSEFRVIAGKDQYDSNTHEDFATKTLEIENIFGDLSYNGASANYTADIVIIVLKSYIEFDSHIGPICVTYGSTMESRMSPVSKHSRVAGWGLTRANGSTGPGRLGEHLKMVELESIDRQKCIDGTDSAFRSRVTSDKFCAGYANSDISVCPSDSGGGLVLPSHERKRTVYYLRGVASAGAITERNCDVNKYATFTDILHYETLIQTYEQRYRPK